MAGSIRELCLRIIGPSAEHGIVTAVEQALAQRCLRPSHCAPVARARQPLLAARALHVDAAAPSKRDLEDLHNSNAAGASRGANAELPAVGRGEEEACWVQDDSDPLWRALRHVKQRELNNLRSSGDQPEPALPLAAGRQGRRIAGRAGNEGTQASAASLRRLLAAGQGVPKRLLPAAADVLLSHPDLASRPSAEQLVTLVVLLAGRQPEQLSPPRGARQRPAAASLLAQALLTRTAELREQDLATLAQSLRSSPMFWDHGDTAVQALAVAVTERLLSSATAAVDAPSAHSHGAFSRAMSSLTAAAAACCAAPPSRQAELVGAITSALLARRDDLLRPGAASATLPQIAAFTASYQRLGLPAPTPLLEALSNVVIAAVEAPDCTPGDAAAGLKYAVAGLRLRHDRVKLYGSVLAASGRCLLDLTPASLEDVAEVAAAAAGDARLEDYISRRAMTSLVSRMQVHVATEAGGMGIRQLARIAQSFASLHKQLGVTGKGGGNKVLLCDAVARSALWQLPDLAATAAAAPADAGAAVADLVESLVAMGVASQPVEQLFDAVASMALQQQPQQPQQHLWLLQPEDVARLATSFATAGDSAALQPLLTRLCDQLLLLPAGIAAVPPARLAKLMDALQGAGCDCGPLLDAAAQLLSADGGAATAASWPAADLTRIVVHLVRSGAVAATADDSQLVASVARRLQQEAHAIDVVAATALADALLKAAGSASSSSKGLKHTALSEALAAYTKSRRQQLSAADATKLLQAVSATGGRPDAQLLSAVSPTLMRDSSSLDFTGWLRLLRALAESGSRDAPAFDALARDGRAKLTAAVPPDQLLELAEALSLAGQAPQALLPTLNRYSSLKAAQFGGDQAARFMLALLAIKGLELRTFRVFATHTARCIAGVQPHRVAPLLSSCLAAGLLHDLLFEQGAARWLDAGVSGGHAATAATDAAEPSTLQAARDLVVCFGISGPASAADTPAAPLLQQPSSSSSGGSGGSGSDASGMSDHIQVTARKAHLADRLAARLLSDGTLAALPMLQVAEVMWSLAARSGATHAGFLSAAADRLLQGGAQLDDDHVRMRSLEAFVAAGHKATALLAAWRAHAVADIAARSTALLVALVWAGAKLGYHDPAFFDAVAARVPLLPPASFSEMEVVRLGEACHILDVHRWPLYEALLAAADSCIPGSAQDRGTLAQGRQLFAELGSVAAMERHGDERLWQLQRIARKCSGRLKALQAKQDLSSRRTWDFDQRMF